MDNSTSTTREPLMAHAAAVDPLAGEPLPVHAAAAAEPRHRAWRAASSRPVARSFTALKLDGDGGGGAGASGDYGALSGGVEVAAAAAAALRSGDIGVESSGHGGGSGRLLDTGTDSLTARLRGDTEEEDDDEADEDDSEIGGSEGRSSRLGSPGTAGRRSGGAGAGSGKGGRGRGRSGVTGSSGRSGEEEEEDAVEKGHFFTMRVSHVLLWLTYCILAGISGVVIWVMITTDADALSIAFAVAAVFVNVAVPLSLFDIHMHMLHYVRPALQRYYVRILWMVPIYAVQSWLALKFKDYKLYVETPRDAYEAYVLYCFFTLMCEFFGSRQALAERLEARGGSAAMLFPFCCVRWRLGYPFLTNTAVGVFQYVFFRLLCTAVALGCEAYGLYDYGVWTWSRAYLYVVVVLNCSQLWALYCLIMFYMQLHEDIAPLRPLGKFVTIKAIVFFSWWQEVIVSGLVWLNVIPAYGDYSSDDIAKGLQDFLICIEIAFFAIAHHYYFSYKDFYDEYAIVGTRKHSARRAVKDMLPTDVFVDAKDIMRAALGMDRSHKRASDWGLPDESELQLAETGEIVVPLPRLDSRAKARTLSSAGSLGSS